MKNVFNKIELFFNKLINMKYFNELYPLVVALIGLIGWRFSNEFGFAMLIIVALIFLLFTKDFNYIIPEIIYFIFVTSNGFTNDKFPITLIIFAVIFVIALVAFIISRIRKNGFHLNKMKSLYGLIALAVMNLLPIFWADIPKGNEVFYFFFFADLGYLLIYLLINSGMEKTNFKLLVNTFIYMGLLIALETFFKAYDVRNTVDNIFEIYFHYGWGLCNEGGIVMCFSIPFLFYKMVNDKNIKNHLLNILKVLIITAGVALTTSRGAYLCFALEVIIAAIVLLFKAEDKKFYRYFVGIGFGIGLILFFSLNKWTFPAVVKIINGVFHNGLSDNGRVGIWMQGFDEFVKSPLNIIFGPGMCSVLEERQSGVDGEFIMQIVPLVMHSTFVETLLMGGIIGVLCLIFHFYEKYKIMFKEGMPFFLTIGLGMLALDLYGMIDNTYHMYYYMIPLYILLACLDNIKHEDLNNSR